MLRMFNSRLPPDCCLIGCTTERILSRENDESTGNPGLEHKRSGHSLVFLPYMEGVSYRHVYIRHTKLAHGQTWAELFGIEQGTPVKLALVTALAHSRDYIPHVAAAIRRTYGPRVVILGAVAHDRLFIDGLVKKARVTALFISGDNFRACAKFVNNDRDSNFYERINSVISESTTDGYEQQLSILITSRFISRGNAFYVNSLTAFREPFSEAPVLGLYSFGEFCLGATDVGKTRPNACKRFMKHNAVVFCACSFKKPHTGRTVQR
ncbi:uncharacterized protein LOC5509735 [Nematostella vectensis]|uniref:uncharacterized protein LOC5509735 n=1 Tax=Nematostella vectensis TaxID=45351 RepID=UPI0020777A78|nr:uncharacterized protein LOC5509735 [Nematostella vectensis]